MKKLVKAVVASVFGLSLFVGTVGENSQVEAKSVANSSKLAVRGLAQYVVLQGEGLIDVSRKTGTSVRDIRTMNGLTSNKVKEGKALLVRSEIQGGVDVWLYVLSVEPKNYRAKVQLVGSKRVFYAYYTKSQQATLQSIAKSQNNIATMILRAGKNGTYTTSIIKKGLK